MLSVMQRDSLNFEDRKTLTFVVVLALTMNKQFELLDRCFGSAVVSIQTIFFARICLENSTIERNSLSVLKKRELMSPELEDQCRRIVLGYATAKNEWDILKYIFDRVQEGRHVAPAHAARVAGLSEPILTERHVQMFSTYILPRDRKYGTTPGGPTLISRDGPFSNISPETILSVTERNRSTVEVVANWQYLSTEGQTMFVLKKNGDRWLIDSLKTSRDGVKWENNHL